MEGAFVALGTTVVWGGGSSRGTQSPAKISAGLGKGVTTASALAVTGNEQTLGITK